MEEREAGLAAAEELEGGALGVTERGGQGVDQAVEGRLGAGQLIGQTARQAALARVGLADDVLLRAMNAADAQPVIRRVLAEETDRLLQAQAKLGLRDSAAARRLVSRAIEPLTFGYGASHALTRQAVSLRAAIR